METATATVIESPECECCHGTGVESWQIDVDDWEDVGDCRRCRGTGRPRCAMCGCDEAPELLTGPGFEGPTCLACCVRWSATDETVEISIGGAR